MFRRRLTSVGLGRRNARGFLSGASGDASLPTADLALRLDARLGVTTVSGDVSAWADQSGNGNDLDQTTIGDRPLYNASDSDFGGAPSVAFDGVSEHLRSVAASIAASGADRTLYLPMNLASAAVTRNVFTWLSTWALNVNSTLTWRIFASAAYPFSVVPTAGVQVITAVASGANNSLYIDGTLAGTATATSQTPSGRIFVGSGAAGGAPAEMTIPGLFLYEAAHDASERAAVLAYIAQEWGV